MQQTPDSGYPDELAADPMDADLDTVVESQYVHDGQEVAAPEAVAAPTPEPAGGHRGRNLALLGVAMVCLVAAGFVLTHLGHHTAPDNPELAHIQNIASSVPATDRPVAKKPAQLPAQTVVYSPSVTPVASAVSAANQAVSAVPATAAPATVAGTTPAQTPAVRAPAVTAATTTPQVASAPAPQVATAPVSAPVTPANSAAPAAVGAGSAEQRVQIEVLTRALAKATKEATDAKAALALAQSEKPKPRVVVKHAPRAHLVAVLKDGAVFKTESGKTVILSVGGQVP